MSNVAYWNHEQKVTKNDTPQIMTIDDKETSEDVTSENCFLEKAICATRRSEALGGAPWHEHRPCCSTSTQRRQHSVGGTRARTYPHDALAHDAQARECACVRLQEYVSEPGPGRPRGGDHRVAAAGDSHPDGVLVLRGRQVRRRLPRRRWRVCPRADAGGNAAMVPWKRSSKPADRKPRHKLSYVRKATNTLCGTSM